MSKKCKAYSVSKLGLDPADNRKAFYAGWDAALAEESSGTEQPAQQEDNLYTYAGVKIWVGNTQASHFVSRTAIEHESIKGMCLHAAADWCLQEIKVRA